MASNHSRKKVVITGASGLIGSRLAPYLSTRGWHVVRLLRRPPDPGSGDGYWDPVARDLDPAPFLGAQAVVHLAGEALTAGRWTAAEKQVFLASRRDGTRFLAQSLGRLAEPPPVLLCASACGYYGDRGEELLTEDSPAGRGFLAEVCQQWEAATAPAADSGLRVVNMRFGVVFCGAGGALPRYATPIRLGLGGILGSGKQYVSWITMADVLAAIAHLLETDRLVGPVNLTTPEAITNATLTHALGRLLERPTLFRVPAFALRAALGDMAQELLLTSTRAVPRKLLDSGYQFQLADLQAALHAELEDGSGLYS